MLAGIGAGVVALAAAVAFRDCPECAEMLVIPGGDFVMGSPDSEKRWAVAHGATPESVSDEAPQHRVPVRTFALGKYDVTRGEYAAFARATGHPAGDGCGHDGSKWEKQAGVSWSKLPFGQTDRDPVVCVSWNDAQAYVGWLNSKSAGYRLPTESEWEYAARGRTTSMFWWSDDDGAAAAHAWYRDNAGGKTQPVGLKDPNAFGLHDMAGDVWQWTSDCYAETYGAKPVEPCMRVDRGGSWFYPTWLLRSATRERNPPGYRDLMMGFRVAKSL